MIQIGALLALVVLAMPAGLLLLGFALGWPAAIGLTLFGLLPPDGMATSLWTIGGELQTMSWAPGGVVGLFTGLSLVAWCRCRPINWTVVAIWPTLLVLSLGLLWLERRGSADFPNLWMRNVVAGAYVAWACIVFWVVFGPAMRWVDSAWARASKDMTGGLNPRVGWLASLSVVAMVSVATEGLGENFEISAIFSAFEAPAPALSSPYEMGLRALSELESSPQQPTAPARTRPEFDAHDRRPQVYAPLTHGRPEPVADGPLSATDLRRAKETLKRFPGLRRLHKDQTDVFRVLLSISDARRLAALGELEARAALVEYRRLAEAVAVNISQPVLVIPDVNSLEVPSYSYFVEHSHLVPSRGDYSSIRGEFLKQIERSGTGKTRLVVRPNHGILLISWPFWSYFLDAESPETKATQRAMRSVPELWPTLLALQRAGNKGAHFPDEVPALSDEEYDELDGLANKALEALVAAQP